MNSILTFNNSETKPKKRVSLLDEIKTIKKLMNINAKNSGSHFFHLDNSNYKGKYDNVYSNFDTKKYYGKDKKRKEKEEKDFIYNKNMIEFLQESNLNAPEKNNSSQNTITNNKQFKNPYSTPIKKKYSVTARLYNYGFYIKNKVQRKRLKEEQENKEKRNTSHATCKSLILAYNKTHQKCLYKSKSQDENSFQPILDQHSMDIAANLEPSYVRLLERKKKTGALVKSYSSIMKEKQKSRSALKKSSDYNDTIPFRILDLYDQGVRKNRSMINLKKGGDVKTEVKRRTKEKGKYQFVKSFDEMYKKQIKWKERVDKKTKKHKKEIDKEFYDDCTFHPKTIPLNLSMSIKEANINAMNNYIERRRNNLKQKEEDTLYKKKRFFETPFASSKKRINSQATHTIEVNKNSENTVPNNIKKMRQLLNLDYFFSDICHNKDITK